MFNGFFERFRANYEVRKHFDAEYYRSQIEQIDKELAASTGRHNLLQHYLSHGWRQGLDPNKNFSTNRYLAINPDVREAGINPFWHYLLVGKSEGRRWNVFEFSGEYDSPHSPSFEEELFVVRQGFNVESYLEENPDVAAAAGIDPVEHFCAVGWKEGRNPSPGFSTEFYLQANDDVRKAGVNPFWHFLVAGSKEGRMALPVAEVKEEETSQNLRFQGELSVVRVEFDANYYLTKNPDVAETEGVDPAEHYCSIGWKEGRDPASDFSTSYYLETNPDVRDAGMNPFWHYLVAGRDEGRRALHPGGYQAEILIKNRTLEEMVSDWRRKSTPDELLDASQICSHIASARDLTATDLLVSVSHDNYTENVGGVQACIGLEEKAAVDRRVMYLNLSPFHPLPRLAHNEDDPDLIVTLILNGNVLGATRMSDLTEAAQTLAVSIPNIEVVVHHLMGHSPEQIVQLVRAFGQNACAMWVHDFFTLCPSSALQRNNVSFCGAPAPKSNACSLCLYGTERLLHLSRIKAMFEDLSIEVIAPSQFAADYWAAKFHGPYESLSVSEHVTLEKLERSDVVPMVPGAPPTVAFVGYPAPHKGWKVFERLVQKFSANQSPIRFVYLGVANISLESVEKIPVQVTAEEPDAMIRALADNEVDIVLHWASCAETFSFSTIEAMAAGAFVLTNPNSGNVAVMVEELGQGAVLEDEEEIEELFRNGGVNALVAEARSYRNRFQAELSYSAITFSVREQRLSA